jgi:hypothetical protein
MDFLQNHFVVAFNSPCRETLKNVLKKKVKGKKSRMAGGWVWDLANVRGGQSIFFWPASQEGSR